MPRTGVLHKQLPVLWGYRETPRGGNMTFTVLCYSLRPSLSSSSIAPVHLCHLTNDCSVAASLPCIIYPELRREQEREKGEQREEILSLCKFEGWKGAVAKSRRREWRERKWYRCRHQETRVCCKGSVKVRIGWRRPQAHFINQSLDLVGNADRSGWK